MPVSIEKRGGYVHVLWNPFYALISVGSSIYYILEARRTIRKPPPFLDWYINLWYPDTLLSCLLLIGAAIGIIILGLTFYNLLNVLGKTANAIGPVGAILLTVICMIGFFDLIFIGLGLTGLYKSVAAIFQILH